MISKTDLEFISSNREELMQSRSTTITLLKEKVIGEDEYTKEPITEVVPEEVNAIVNGFTGTVGGERLLVGGLAIQEGDINIVFNADVDLTNVKTVEHKGILYRLFSVLPKGLGEVNRYDCIARRVAV
ncbi:hypothetical protein [Jeotgalibacillus marinus]|uniref:Uncharacterized protein n=1 Tax=Jeotgalibacillus marinus TaxID=86667 RepID=A0ABV3Q7D1_9BACL